MIKTWYFGFHRPHFESWFGIFGHVEVWGVDENLNWFFLDPTRFKTNFEIIYHHDEVSARLGHAFNRCELVLRYEGDTTPESGWPLRLPMNCVNIAGHMVGIRASSPRKLRAKLLKKGAEVLKDGRAERKQRKQTSAA